METLSKHFREITKATFARHGFAQGEVVSHWAAIVGDELAAISAPERIRWPRAAGADQAKSGGTLVVRASPGRAIDIEYEAPRLIARVNAFFGHGAIARVKVVQAPGSVTQAPRKAPASAPLPLHNQQLQDLEDGPLKAALTRLGQGVAGARQSSPQGK